MSKLKEALVAAWNAVKFTSVLIPLIAGGLGGAIYTHWVNTRPADIEPRMGDYVLLMGKPLLGLMVVFPVG